MRLEHILEDFRDGIILEVTLQNRLKFLSFEEEKRQAQKNRNVRVKLKDYVGLPTMSPEEILLEQERYQELFHMVREIKDMLSEKQFRIFWWNCILGIPQKKIALLLGISQGNVSKTMRLSLRKLRRRFKVDPIKETVLPKPPGFEARVPEVKIRYPVDFLKDTWVSGRPGKRKWLHQTKCTVLQYLDECFGDQLTICSYCDRKCRNRAMKERGKHNA